MHMYTQMQVIESLIYEHEKIRTIMDDCELMADEIDSGGGSMSRLLAEVSRLRLALAEHNQHEEASLPSILKAADAFGDLRVEHMLTTHRHEHRSMYDRLSNRPTSALRATIQSLREHLASEELYFAIACTAPDPLEDRLDVPGLRR